MWRLLTLLLLAPAAIADDKFCITLEGVSEALQHRPIWIAPAGQTVVSVGCNCQGTCSTPTATFSFEDRAENPIGLTGGLPLPCSLGATPTTFVTVDVTDPDRLLVTGEGLATNVTNTPATHDKVVLCVQLSEP